MPTPASRNTCQLGSRGCSTVQDVLRTCWDMRSWIGEGQVGPTGANRRDRAQRGRVSSDGHLHVNHWIKTIVLHPSSRTGEYLIKICFLLCQTPLILPSSDLEFTVFVLPKPLQCLNKHLLGEDQERLSQEGHWESTPDQASSLMHSTKRNEQYGVQYLWFGPLAFDIHVEPAVPNHGSISRDCAADPPAIPSRWTNPPNMDLPRQRGELSYKLHRRLAGTPFQILRKRNEMVIVSLSSATAQL